MPSIGEIQETRLKEQRPYPPCRAACPVHTDVQAYVGLIAQGRYTEAFDLIRSVNPIASACSLICHHPCEQECRRCDVDEPLAVRNLKRFALEQSIEYRRKSRHAISQSRNKSVAIIGSGPSGLTAANDLADLGYKVTIFERNPVLGGLLSSAIPSYRLPRDFLQEDIDDVLAKGVEAKTNCEIGKDITIAELLKQYNAILTAVGLSLSRSLPIPGVEGPGVLLALPFLSDCAFGKKPALGKKVLVIGGGNVAIDVARSALRLGIKNVEMVCLESAEEMPAWEWEIHEALDENVKITNRWGPKAVRRSNGHVEGLDVVKVKAVFDESGRFNPSFYEDQTSFIPADTIIIAIGQMSNLSFLKDTEVKIDERGRLVWNELTQMSSAPGVFVSGEVITGPGSAIQAAANGHRAAKAIHLYLEGENVEAALKKEEKEKIEKLPPDILEMIKKESRANLKFISPDVRCAGFTQFEIGYDEYSALREAARCRGCGSGAVVNPDKCVACLTCLRVCPYDAPVVTNKADIPPERCQACGLCAPECPCQAISMVGYDVREIINTMPGIIGTVDPRREKPVLIEFYCTYHAGVNKIPELGNVHQIPVHCSSRVGINDMLKAFECGADGVYLMLCSEDPCKHKGVVPRMKKRIEYTQKLLSEIGIERGRLRYFEISGEHGEARRRAAEEMTQQVKVSR
jgi:NADPH-dependent glutamate synthase beta subunit-like oxidoreductase/coenzyme F420-reducing hydrogenase delta subunit/ferredoxin